MTIPTQQETTSALLALGLAALLTLGAGACAPGSDGADEAGDPATGDPAATPGPAAAELDGAQGDPSALAVTIRNAMTLADSVHDLLRPVPLMRPAEEEALRRYSNAATVRVARELGVRPASRTELEAALEDGRLVTLEDSTEHWVLRRGVTPYVTPDTYALLERLGDAFQDRLESMGLPRYRLEISSVLRTAEEQAALRRSNPNAASGTSAHEFGTTVDVVYEAYPAPAELPSGLVPADDVESSAEEARLALVASTFLERMAARKSRELTKILGEVMGEAQADGIVLVTLERQQPVYHITVAERLR